MAEIKKISVGGVTYDLKDEKARTIAENPMLPVTGILDAQGGTDVTSKATSHRGIFYAGNGVFKAKSISNDTDFHSTWNAYDYNNVHYPANDVYASRGGAFSNALYLMEGSLYRIQAGAMVQVVQGSAGEGGELGEDVSIVKSGSSYVFGNGAVVGQNAQLNGTIATGANVGEGAKVGKSTYIGEAAVIHGGVKIGTKAEGHGGVYINSDVDVDDVSDGDTWIGKDVTVKDGAIVGENTAIGDGICLVKENKALKVRDMANLNAKDISIGEGVSIADVTINKNYKNNDIKINTVGSSESEEITLGKAIHIGTNTFIDSGIDYGLLIKSSRQNIEFGTDVGLGKVFFIVDDSSLSIGTSMMGKIKFVAEEAPELTIGSGYLNWGSNAFIKPGDKSITVHDENNKESTLSWGTGVLAVPTLTFEIKTPNDLLNYDKVTFGFNSLSLGTGTLEWSTDKIQVDNQSIVEVPFGVDFGENGYVRLFRGSKYVKIPLNNQTIGAVSDETISV